ncbi:MAG: hypothetical protein AMS15_05970 [Planctomycetes bacterium DG_23]|nr:MAG: hypothetical protein AMS15_05970 [Planctomycetes bacterium DG_23]
MGSIGILTGGGDCPGLNAVIRAIVKKAEDAGKSCVGILEGWRGMIEGETMPLDTASTGDMVASGGTILGTSRTNPFKREGAVEAIKENFSKLDLEVLIAIGGDDTLGVAARLFEEEALPTVGVPKTIDNDLPGTDFTFGFDTAVNIATEAVDRIHTTAKSHRRCIVVETMGRHVGWIAAYTGVASGADVVLVPEKPIDVDKVAEILKRNRSRGKEYNVVVVSEGAQFQPGDYVSKAGEVDEFGNVRLGGVGVVLADLIEDKTGYETRTVVLGHIQRGGAPSTFDRILATRFGLKAAELALERDYGKMVALRGNRIDVVPIKECLTGVKALDDEFVALTEAFS